ncbi:TolC family protein [Pontibacter ramchanderi]|uniref:Outer membrane protein TolC n=1 Tax=Pontibacter ramchanderi TaxID=1179743 RepID=A0A2N3UBR6_9BACT|nr:TolC family protein [Pontibacter ramchanderi]PKV66814.1 outer membrane protein TolC [Pontibacter ramchanderi]
MRRYLFLVFLLLLLCLTGIAQPGAAQPSDSVQVLTMHALYEQVLAHHPLSAQAALLARQADQELRMARGGFDPVLDSKYGEKQFSDKEYYTYWNNSLRVPLWFGPQLLAGYERSSGPYLNPEKYTPSNGLSYAGIAIPLGQGLFMDERRSIVRQAQLLPQMAEADRLKLVNKLLLDVAKDYWDWLYYYHEVQVYREALELAEVRTRAVNERARQGDLAAIDTVEARTEALNRRVLLSAALQQYNNSKLRVEMHLWDEGNQPLGLTANAVPSAEGTELDPLSAGDLQELVALAKVNHPDIVKLDLKGQQLEVERRFAADKLKPKLDVEYNLLQSDFFMNGEAFQAPYMRNNYRLGVSFSQPLFLREERGKLQLIKIKQQEVGFQQTYTLRAIENAVQMVYNEWLALEEQLALQEQMVTNARILQEGEVVKFQSGESSIFLINAREQKLLESQIKLYDLRSKYAKTKAQLYWSAGSMQRE